MLNKKRTDNTNKTLKTDLWHNLSIIIKEKNYKLLQKNYKKIL